MKGRANNASRHSDGCGWHSTALGSKHDLSVVFVHSAVGDDVTVKSVTAARSGNT